MENSFGYIMVTDFYGYWNNIRTKGGPSYPPRMIKGMVSEADLREGTPTLFVKNYKSENSSRMERAPKVERVWKGSVHQIEQNPSDGKYYFRVEIEEEVMDRAKYEGYENGWYISRIDLAEKVPSTDLFSPPLFAKISTINDFNWFEIHVYYLLKMIGINSVHRIPRENNRGKADGFFRIGSLAVLYDATLESDFEKEKSEQIENYCGQMQRGRIDFDKVTEEFHSHEKQVWIITRGRNRLIREKGEVVVKEIPVSKLIEIYEARLHRFESERELEMNLRNI